MKNYCYYSKLLQNPKKYKFDHHLLEHFDIDPTQIRILTENFYLNLLASKLLQNPKKYKFDHHILQHFDIDPTQIKILISNLKMKNC